MNTEAQEAAAAWGASPQQLISERENAVWEIRLPDGARAALRLHRRGYQSEAAIRSELWWCAALAGAGAPVPPPLPDLRGDQIVRLSSGRLASVIAWVEGAPFGAAGVPLAGCAADKAAQMAQVGRLIAQCHEASDGLRLPEGFARPAWDAEGLVGADPLWGRFWEHPLLSAHERDILLKSRALIRQLAENAQKSGDYGLIHADVLRENVLVSSTRYWLIDFDDAGFGLRAYDPGTFLSQSLSEPGLEDLVQALCAGYREVRALDSRLLAGMTLARCCASVGWMVPRLPPEHPVQRRHIDRAVSFARYIMEGKAENWG